MSDEQAPVVEQDKPTDQDAPDAEGQATDEPTEGSTPDPEQLQRSYDELRTKFTQTSQEAAQHRLIVEAAANPNHPQHEEALEYLGLESEEDEDEYLDEDEELAARIEAIESRQQEALQAQQEAELEEAETDWLAEQIGSLQEKEGREFDDKELNLIVRAATGNRLEDGQPDIEGAYGLLTNVYDARKKDWVSSKRAPQVPTGASASQQIDLDDAEQRREYLARRMSEEL